MRCCFVKHVLILIFVILHAILNSTNYTSVGNINNIKVEYNESLGYALGAKETSKEAKENSSETNAAFKNNICESLIKSLIKS